MMSSAHSAVLAVLHGLNLAGAYADRVMVMPHPQTDKPIVLVSFEGEAASVPALGSTWKSNWKN